MIKNDKGSTLILLVIIISLISVTGLSIMSVTMTQYEIRKSNSEIKRTFYMSENGLNYAYVDIYYLIETTIEESEKTADDFINENPSNQIEGENIFYNNFKKNIINKIVKKNYNYPNTYIEVTNKDILAFDNNRLLVKVSSKYISGRGIEKIISADFIIVVPSFYEVKSNDLKLLDLLSIDNWQICK
ncbi:hypothetical protein [Sedimentibacter sp. MB31-C6]|uniref:hypothetical protein n=1 Tax=Sedimentibacter sp. MB31-C6 TaxID=3109366 RepID=UPI002DDD4E1B|nr:hypothetical protein [Sedimentibacter sp. MB36-C1]WSI03810.1 hypothetical protein U8307_12310 [Sedimentibacter sp. MB36-C1]